MEETSLGYFVMDKGIATVVKVNSNKLLQVIDNPSFFTDERLKEELYHTTVIEVDIK